MSFPAAKTLRLAAIAAGLLCFGLNAGAEQAAGRLARYEAAISSGNPAAALEFLKDGEVRTLAEKDQQKGAELTAEAEALKDLKDLLAMPWNAAEANKLNQSLAIRIDIDKPLVKAGIGPEPEKLLTWLAKYNPAYPAGKKMAVVKAIRQWDVVFGTMTDTRGMDWAQATQRYGQGVNLTKANWEKMTLRERNTVINELIETEPSFLNYNDVKLVSAKDQVALMKTVNEVKNSGALSPAQLGQLAGKPFADQVYLLGSFFDNSKVGVSDDIKSRIHAARDSMPKEVLPAQQRDLLGGMLTRAVAKELAGTKAGDRALAAGPLKIEVRPCDGSYSEYDPATGAIVLDSETIQQYMRMKGYTADSVMKSKEQVAEIAKYMSPSVVYESAHKMQADWAQKQGVYKPHMQEDEIEAMSLEGLYTNEKFSADPVFKAIIDGSRKFSSYASKKNEVATKFKNTGDRGFSQTVRKLYFSGLPSLDGAAAQVRSAISGELARRAALPAAEKAEIDASGLTLNDALEMSPDELAGSVKEVQTAALAKIARDLQDMAAYSGRYDASEKITRGTLTSSAAPAGKKSGPPAL